MSDEEFEKSCEQLADLADIIASGSPEQISAFAESGWWDALETLRHVYNDWLT